MKIVVLSRVSHFNSPPFSNFFAGLSAGDGAISSINPIILPLPYLLILMHRKLEIFVDVPRLLLILLLILLHLNCLFRSIFPLNLLHFQQLLLLRHYEARLFFLKFRCRNWHFFWFSTIFWENIHRHAKYIDYTIEFSPELNGY